eukprot:scaffold89534_cov22-Cyclotella_meneghiniana.AAC.1
MRLSNEMLNNASFDTFEFIIENMKTLFTGRDIKSRYISMRLILPAVCNCTDESFQAEFSNSRDPHYLTPEYICASSFNKMNGASPIETAAGLRMFVKFGFGLAVPIPAEKVRNKSHEVAMSRQYFKNMKSRMLQINEDMGSLSFHDSASTAVPRTIGHSGRSVADENRQSYTNLTAAGSTNRHPRCSSNVHYESSANSHSIAYAGHAPPGGGQNCQSIGSQFRNISIPIYFCNQQLLLLLLDIIPLTSGIEMVPHPMLGTPHRSNEEVNRSALYDEEMPVQENCTPGASQTFTPSSRNIAMQGSATPSRMSNTFTPASEQSCPNTPGSGASGLFSHTIGAVGGRLRGTIERV